MLPTVAVQEGAGHAALTVHVAAVQHDEVPTGCEQRPRRRQEMPRQGVVEVVQHADGDDPLARARPRRGVEGVDAAADPGAPVAEASAGVLHVVGVRFEADVLDCREEVEEVRRAAAEVDDPLTGLGADVALHQCLPHAHGADGLLQPAVHGCEREHAVHALVLLADGCVNHAVRLLRVASKDSTASITRDCSSPVMSVNSGRRASRSLMSSVTGQPNGVLATRCPMGDEWSGM